MDMTEVPLFQLPVPAVLTGNMEGVDQDIEMNGIDSIGSDGGGSGGGGLPEGFTEEELDVVNDDNTAGTRIFLTKQP